MTSKDHMREQVRFSFAFPMFIALGAMLLLASAPATSAQGRAASPATLDIYFVDVEGGQSTLIVTPARQSLLVDTGWADFDGRDAGRIMQVAKLAGIHRIDYLLITHFHMDHVGGVPQLAERIPIGTFMDHGRDVQNAPPDQKLYSAYLKTAEKGTHRVVKPGDTFPLTGVNAVIVVAAGRHIEKPLDGAGRANPYCSATKPMAPDPSENAQSAGMVLTFGKFRFVDLGDLTWNKEIALMCPKNLLGRADVFLASHHGNSNSNSDALAWALAPRVTVIDNGAKKGGTPEAWKRLHDAPGHNAIWQIHYSEAGDGQANAAPDFIANLNGSPDRGHYLKVSARPDGSFTVTNSRNGFSVNYPARH